MADSEVNQLPAIASLALGDEFHVNDASTSNASDKATLQQIVDLFSGKQTIWIPARDMQPGAVAGCAPLATLASGSARPDSSFLAFDQTSEEDAQFYIGFPKSWNLGTVTFQVIWETADNTTNGVAWGVEAVAVHDTERLQDSDYGAPVSVVDNATANPVQILISAESSALTIANTPVDGDLIAFQIFRDVSNPGDDSPVDGRLIGLRIFFTADNVNDN